MTATLLKFYPVGNGDTSLIKLRNNTSFIIDCKIRNPSDDTDNFIYDVKSDLLLSLSNRDNIPYTDVFILTHPDKDHCLGFDKHFYRGDPNNYSKQNLENNEIIIDELWVTSMLFTLDQCDEANAIKEEANRRIKLCNEGNSKQNIRGNRIRLIGYDSGKKFQNVQRYIPGQEIKYFNDDLQSHFSFFIHSPFKESLVEGRADKNRNQTSIILQARFYNMFDPSKFACRVLLGGDADHFIWEKVLEKTKENDNEHALNYDILLSPHHCSWTYFNNVPYSEYPDPQSYSLEILGYKEKDAFIIASSKEIIDNEDNPPHFPAKEEYLKVLDNNSNFLNTSNYVVDGNIKPITFSIDETRFKKLDKTDQEKEKQRNKQARRKEISQGIKPWRRW